jgi:DNA-binding CsgD family transcriptional regulator/tetratricopeptide (TPR) repeat protein
VLEDVHWADEATLDVLRIVARRLETLPALVVATFRDDELERHALLRILLGEIAHGRQAVRVDVEPLSPTAVSILAAPHGVDADDLYRKTNGNPFFVTEALASPEAEVPDTVRDAVLARAARLTYAAREVLEAVAVVPPHAELWLLDALVPASIDRLEECLVSGMLRAERGRVSFRHELARLAIEESLPPSDRVALHRRTLEALQEPPHGPPDLARLAHHAEAAGDVDAVLRLAPAAAERAASVGAHREAAAHYDRALRFGERLSVAERASYLERRGQSLYLTDQNPEAIDALRAALDCYRQLGDRRAEGKTLQMISQFLWCPGRVAESEEAGRLAVALLERLEPVPELGHAYANLAFLSRTAGRHDESIMWATRAQEAAERWGDVELLVSALAGIGESEALAGRGTGEEKLEQALGLAEQHELVQALGWISISATRTLLRRRDFRTANERLASGLAYCSEHGLELYRDYLLAYGARAELEQGRWAEAVEFTEPVLRRRRASTTPRILALTVVGVLRARRGDPDPWSPLDEALALALASGELPRIGPAVAAKAETAWLAGDLDSIVPLTDAAYERALELKASSLAGELAVWRRRAGLREEPPAGVDEPHALQLAGECERAANLWARIGCPYEAALALVDAGEEQPLRRALDELLRLGAPAAAAIVARRLRERGVRGLPRGPRPATRRNPAQLTARELEVLDLVAAGLRNGEIAARLVLSERTVHHHVGAILRKLDVRTRAQAGAEAARLGLTADGR